MAASGKTITVPNVTTTGTQNYVGDSTLNGNLTTAGGIVQLGGQTVTLAANVLIDTTNDNAIPAGANISSNNTIDGAHALTLNAGTAGNIVLQKAVGGTTPLASLTIGERPRRHLLRASHHQRQPCSDNRHGHDHQQSTRHQQCGKHHSDHECHRPCWKYERPDRNYHA